MTRLTCPTILNPVSRFSRWLPKAKRLLPILALALLINNCLLPSEHVSVQTDQSSTSALSHPARSITVTELLPAQPTAIVTAPVITAETSLEALATATITVSASAPLPESTTPVLDSLDWQNWPIIPTVSGRMLAVYQEGLAVGNNPQAFSKIGDGEISTQWFLTEFDLGPQYYNLGSYSGLLPAIEYFAGSFGRNSQAARRGFNTTRILDPSLADPNFCNPGETPLACELRLHRPSFALISLGANQVWAPVVLELELRQIIKVLLAHGVVPVLSTKADNLEGDYRINTIIAGLAAEYEAPLWNFWRAVQPLPEHGLQGDLEHLTYAPNYFADPVAMEHAWPVRNLTALQVLYALREAVR